MVPSLNWKELEIYVRSIQTLVEGAWIERVIIPSRASFPGGYLKNEWAFLIRSSQKSLTLLWSVRPQAPYIALHPDKTLSNASNASQSPFGLSLSKKIRHSRIESIRTLKRDRCVWIDLSDGLAIVLRLIPASPEAFLLEGSQGDAEKGWPVLARSRAHSENLEERFFLPDSSKAPESMPVNEERISSPQTYFGIIEDALKAEALQTRWQIAQKELTKQIKIQTQNQRSLREQLAATQKEPDWNHYGALLKSVLHDPPELGKNKTRRIFDYTTETSVEIPCDPKLTLQQQLEKFFNLSRRKLRRLEETQERLDVLEKQIQKLSTFYQQKNVNWETLVEVEKFFGFTYDGTKPPNSKKTTALIGVGRKFLSREKLEIWAGKTEKENLELTFRKAKGNDLWFHVKGRPSAHVVVLIPSGKSASLETLLDAAHLVLHYSGYTNEAKVEVDYTFRKFVKRIKNSTQVSYTQNKTLIVQFDPKRIQKIFNDNPM